MDREPDQVNHTLDRSFLTADIGELVEQLTTKEKIQLLAGHGWWHTFAYPRLNIPSIKVTDGPAGARGGSAYAMTPVTSFPNATCLGATFDHDLAREMGAALADETRARGATCLLAPTINIQRSPLGGRAFESYAEDPTLSGQVAADYVNGLQDAGVSAAIKHFVCNDQEHDRMGQDSIVGPRALREVYLRPFQIAQAKAQPWSFMTSYNKVNGTHASESKWLLDQVLRKEWGADTLVMSDWTGVYSASESINAGLDIEFPGPTKWRTDALIQHALTTHKILPEKLDELATHVLRWAQKLAQKNPEVVYSKEKKEVTRWEAKEADSALVRRIISEGIVLLKNEGDILPVRKGKVAVIGPNAKAKVFTGGGSARLNPSWSSTPWQGLVGDKPDGVDLEYALGITTAKYAPLLDESFTTSDGDVGFEAWHYPITETGEQAAQHVAHDKLTRSEIRFNNFKREGLADHWFTELKSTFTAPITGDYAFSATCTGKFWVWIDDKLVMDMGAYKEKGQAFYGNGTPEIRYCLPVQEGKTYQIRLLHDTRPPPDLKMGQSTLRYDGMRFAAEPAYDEVQAMADAEALAASSDTAIVVCGLNQDWESEGDDRPSLQMPLRTDELIERVAAKNPNTIVVIQGGSAVSMPWLSRVRGVVQAWYGGCETGTGIADVVYGRVNPSGRLPVTFPKREEDVPAFLSFKSANGLTYYEEGIWVGYKWYNARRIPTLFPFGYGLSYTTFEYEGLKIDSVSPKSATAAEWRLEAQVTVRNTGNVVGSHSVHFYVSPPEERAMGLKHPKKSLQAYAKVHGLKPGESTVVKVSMDKYAISHWDERFDVWVAEAGKWGLSVGKTAEEFHGDESFEVGKGIRWTGV